MNESAGNPDDSRALSEEELAEVSGGYGCWDIDQENNYRTMHDNSRQYRREDYETWITDSPGMDDDSLRCRLEWIAAGRPNNREFIVSNEGGPVWSTSHSFRAFRG